MAQDQRMKRFYMNWEQQNDMMVVMQALLKEGLPGMTNAKGEIVESVGINHLVRIKKEELIMDGEWDALKAKAEEAGGMWDL